MSILKYLFINTKKTVTLQLNDINPCSIFTEKTDNSKPIPLEYKNKIVGNSGLIIDFKKQSIIFYFNSVCYEISINEIKVLSILLTGNDPDRGNRCTFSKLVLYRNDDNYIELFEGGLDYNYRLSELKKILNICDITLKIEDNPSDIDYLVNNQGQV